MVAEKYQTGFDQPKLCAMYVDRKLAGLQAVQTLSRLNRTCPGKEHTFILDFQNTMEDIQKAFRPYFEMTALEPYQTLTKSINSKAASISSASSTAARSIASPQPSTRGHLSGGPHRPRRSCPQGGGRFEADDDRGGRKSSGNCSRATCASTASSPRSCSWQIPASKSFTPMRLGWPGCCRTVSIRPDIEITEEMLRLQAFKVEQKEEGNASLVRVIGADHSDQGVRGQALHRGRAERALRDRQGIQ